MGVLDKANQEIIPGKFIIYGHALGRCAGLRFGRVIEVKNPEPTGNQYNPYTYGIKIRGVDYEWRQTTEPSLLKRDSTLFFPDRIIVLHDNQVPEEVKKLYIWMQKYFS